MNFYTAFWSVLRSQPSRALSALYWHVTGRKVRARNRLRIGMSQGPDAYQLWIETVEGGAPGAPAAAQAWAYRPLISVLICHRDGLDDAALDALVVMMQAQIYPEWELIVIRSSRGLPLVPRREKSVRIIEQPATGGGEALQMAARIACGDYMLPLPPCATLPATALFRYVEALQPDPAADILFGDHDEINHRGVRRHPWFKPQWNGELALAQDYFSQAILISARSARETAGRHPTSGKAAAYALTLAIASREGAVVHHVPHIQAHLMPDADAPTGADRAAVVRSYLEATGASDAVVSKSIHGTTRIDWPLPDPLPLVSIIIPTRDGIDLLQACLSSLSARTSYRPFEIIVVDNGSVRPDSLAYLAELADRDGIAVIRDDRPYNYSQLNNLAVAAAGGDYLCLLNNDTEVIEGDWLSAMMRQAVRPHVGAVGARLLYDDGSIQHAGVTVGLGEAAGHAHRFQRQDAVGYFARVDAAHYVSAVTAACLVVEKRKFLAVGGLDEESLAVAFNDVDLCLKLQQAGWRNIYTPYATLLHHESKSRGKDFSPQHIERYRRELRTLQERWGTCDYADPLHHAYLDRSSEKYLIKL